MRLNWKSAIRNRTFNLFLNWISFSGSGTYDFSGLFFLEFWCWALKVWAGFICICWSGYESFWWESPMKNVRTRQSLCSQLVVNFFKFSRLAKFPMLWLINPVHLQRGVSLIREKWLKNNFTSLAAWIMTVTTFVFIIKRTLIENLA